LAISFAGGEGDRIPVFWQNWDAPLITSAAKAEVTDHLKRGEGVRGLYHRRVILVGYLFLP